MPNWSPHLATLALDAVDDGSVWWADVGWPGWIGAVGIAATLIGLWFAYAAAVDAKTAATEARSAAKAAAAATNETWDRLARATLQTTAPQLRAMSRSLDKSVEAGDAGWTRHHSTQASVARGAING